MMLARRYTLPYLDAVLGAVLLIAGTLVTAVVALGWFPLTVGFLGLVTFGFGKLLCQGAMARRVREREERAFEFGHEAGLRAVEGSRPTRGR